MQNFDVIRPPARRATLAPSPDALFLTLTGADAPRAGVVWPQTADMARPSPMPPRPTSTDAHFVAAVQHMTRQPDQALHDLQHRMGNSLQIIASILSQSAKDATTVEARRELQYAHCRVMAVAALQRLLCTTGSGAVLLDPYLRGIADCVTDSLLPDGQRMAVVIDCGTNVMGGAAATSLGLVVTEVLINTIKHACPDHPGGTVTIVFRMDRADWTLTVSDDGSGHEGAAAKPGLGSRILPALAAQLGAVLTVDRWPTGRKTVLIHTTPGRIAAGEGHDGNIA